ncbi:MAG: YeeE/YedE family protein [Parvibaculales bacterium]
MMIDYAQFSPGTALLGGSLIGFAAALLYALNGRILGASGIAGSALAGVLTGADRNDLGWRLAFLAGVITGPVMYALLTGGLPVQVHIADDARLIAAGLIVGLGTGLGSGCTSGHGICGLARFSRRSLVAVLVFMATGFFATFILHHVVGL